VAVARVSYSMGQASGIGSASWNGHMNSVNVSYSKFIEQCKWSRMDVEGLLRFTGLNVEFNHA
jgi:hypothetical protein